MKVFCVLTIKHSGGEKEKAAPVKMFPSVGNSSSLVKEAQRKHSHENTVLLLGTNMPLALIKVSPKDEDWGKILSN